MIKKLYDKNELWFALLWILAYVLLASIGDILSTKIGIAKIFTFPILLILSLLLITFLKRNSLEEEYGLRNPKTPAFKMLFYIPLIILITANLWHGFTINTTLTETILFILSMFCVGFLEEIIFRGLLFNALAKKGVYSAIIISSISFGMGHIVNLINGSGAQLLPNIIQVIYATATGFTFVIIYYKTKSLIPCILTHCIFNGLSIFSNESATTIKIQIISGLIITFISVSYAVYLALTLKEKEEK